MVVLVAINAALLAPDLVNFSAGTKNDHTSQNSAQRQSQPAVTLYATDRCSYCAATRDLFVANGIRYTELGVEKSGEAAEGHRRLGGNGVPLIVVGDEIVHGYNEAQLRKLLKPWLDRF